MSIIAQSIRLSYSRSTSLHLAQQRSPHVNGPVSQITIPAAGTFGARNRAPSIIAPLAAALLWSCGSLAPPLASLKLVGITGEKNRFKHESIPPGPFHRISAGYNFTCAIRVSGEVVCWGSNRHGQSAPPKGRFVEISAGDDHACALDFSAEAICWGANTVGETVAPPGPFRSISAGVGYSCGVRKTGELKCWGDVPGAETAYLSSGAFVSPEDPRDRRFVYVDAGRQSICGLESNGRVLCWSDKDRYSSDEDDDGTVIIPGFYIGISGDSSHFGCGLTSGREIKCWGSFDSALYSIPTRPIRKVMTGSGYACALDYAGSIECWGPPGNGVKGPPEGSYKDFDAGSNHGCAIRRTDLEAVCWGATSYCLAVGWAVEPRCKDM
jgi:alpha-tubulin suppressor-like RCC1 family protein